MKTDITKIFSIIFVLTLALYFWFNCNKVIQHISPTYDEPLHLMQGYAYLKTGSTYIIKSDDHPLLAKIVAGFGLLFLKPQPVVYTLHDFWINRQRYSFSNLMLYYNNHDAELLLNTGRRCIIFVSSIFLIIYFFLIKNKTQLNSAIVASILYCFNTSIISHACLTTQDMLASIIYFLAIYSFIRFLESKRNKDLLYCSVITGVMMVTKYSVAVLLFTYFVVVLYFWITKIFCFKDVVKFWLYQIFGIFLVGIVVYNKNLYDLFTGFIRVVSSTQEGRSTFFFGKYSTVGFILYFPTLFLLKTELPLLILCFISFIKFFYDILRKTATKEDILIVSSILIYLTIASLSKMQIGHRHILPVYPLLIWQVSKLSNVKRLQWLCYILVLWNIFVSVKAYPKYLSYFNEIIGGSKNGWKYFTDSNIDWGQGLKQLGQWVSKNNYAKNGIYLSYFGVADPNYYGIKYKPIGFVSNLTWQERHGEDIIKNNIERIIIAVSVTNLQSTYYQDKTVFNFLKNINPTVVCNDSIFVYDITEQKDLLEKFIQLLSRLGYYEDIEYISKKFLKKEGER